MPFLRAIAKIQKENKEMEKAGIPPIQTALVTARNSPAHKRVILTFRTWGIKIDEMFFLGGISKDQVLRKFKPHIFFDDQDAHAAPASKLVPSAKVPPGGKKQARRDEGHPTLPFDKEVGS